MLPAVLVLLSHGYGPVQCHQAYACWLDVAIRYIPYVMMYVQGLHKRVDVCQEEGF